MSIESGLGTQENRKRRISSVALVASERLERFLSHHVGVLGRLDGLLWGLRPSWAFANARKPKSMDIESGL